VTLLFFSNLFPTADEPYRGLDNAILLHALAPEFKVRVLSPRPLLPWSRDAFSPRAEDRALEPRWVRSQYLPKIGGPVNHMLMAASLRAAFEETMRDFKPEVILSSWIYPDVCAALELAGGRFPVVAIAQGSDIHQYLAMPARRRVILDRLPRAAGVITRSRDLGRLLESAGFPAAKLHTVYNGVDTETFRPRDQAGARREFFLPDGPRIILFVGNFFKVKNPHYLIMAVGMLKAMPGERLLVMVGGGPWEGLCRDLTAKLQLNSSVIFAGRKSPREVARMMNAADVLALPSQNEGVPNVIIEAFASGLPVVASNVGGIPEVHTQGALGRLVPPGDVKALATALGEQLAAPRDAAAIRAHGEKFTWPAAAARYGEILRAARS
jgi:teichuronic acid biosynthesis glycosyltransferase TuaC